MTEILFHAHSGMRYLVLLAAAIAMVYLLQAALRGQAFDKLGRVLTAVFTGLLDLQLVLGLVLLLVFPWYSALAGHLVLMLAAVALAHVLAVVRKKRPGGPTNLQAAIGVAVPLALVIGGILAIGRPLV